MKESEIEAHFPIEFRGNVYFTEDYIYWEPYVAGIIFVGSLFLKYWGTIWQVEGMTSEKRV